MRKHILLVVCLLSIGIEAMAQKYHVTAVARERILVDKSYASDAEGDAFLAPFKSKVDSVTSPIVGRTAKYMKAYSPESELSNLLADIMVWCGTKYGEKPDIGLYNMGGIRAALPKGDVTFGDVIDVAPFENKICFLSLTGEQLLTLFDQIAHSHGAGVSRGIEAVVHDRSLQSLRLNGEEIDPKRIYRIATLDYLVQGNDGFRMLQQGTDVNMPTDSQSNTRFLIIDYFRQKLAKGETVDSNIEGRVLIK